MNRGRGLSGNALASFSWDRSQAEQDRATGSDKCVQGRLCPHPPRSYPSSFAAAGWGPGVPGAPVIGSLQMAGVPWNLLAKHAFPRGPHCLTLLYQKAGNG